jgi:YD repeat-containing protein
LCCLELEATHNYSRVMEPKDFLKQIPIHSVNNQEGDYAYKWNGKMLSYTDVEGLKTIYTYDDDYNVISIIKDPNGLAITTKFEYDLLNQKVKTIQVNPVGEDQVQTLHYDLAKRLIAQKRWLGATALSTTTTLDKVGNILSITDPKGYQNFREYDVAHRLVATVDAVEMRVERRLNKRGDLTSQIVDPANLAITTTFEMDALGRVTTVHESDGGVSMRTYDPNGNILTSQDPNGNTQAYYYDERNLVIRSVDALGVETTYKFDGMGNRVQVVDANGTVIRTDYDLKSFVEKTTEDVGGIKRETFYERDKLMHPTVTIDAYKTVTLTEYDAIYRPIMTIADATGKKVVNESIYNNLNQIMKQIDAGGFETNF